MTKPVIAPEQSLEELAKAIEAVDWLSAALILPMPAQFHVDRLREDLPAAVEKLKTCFAAANSGINPWKEDLT
jgi:hypothetical protein